MQRAFTATSTPVDGASPAYQCTFPGCSFAYSTSLSLFLSGRTKTMSATFRDSRHTSCWIRSREQTLSFEGFRNDKDDDPFVVLRSSAIDDQRMEEEETRWFNIEFKWPPKERKHVCTQTTEIRKTVATRTTTPVRRRLELATPSRGN